MAYVELPATDTHKELKGFFCFGKDPNEMSADELESFRADMDKVMAKLERDESNRTPEPPRFANEEEFIEQLRKDLGKPDLIHVDYDGIPQTELEYMRALFTMQDVYAQIDAGKAKRI